MQFAPRSLLNSVPAFHQMSSDSPATQQLNAIRAIHERHGPNEHVKVVAARLREEFKVG